jgi:hypothetical protein
MFPLRLGSHLKNRYRDWIFGKMFHFYSQYKYSNNYLKDKNNCKTDTFAENYCSL